MNGHNTNKTRRNLDHYPTQDGFFNVLSRYLDLRPAPVHEPCCGDGSLSNQMKNHGLQVISSDIENYGYGEVIDAFDITDYKNIVTNPPYKIADDLIEHWLNTTSHYVCCLMRLSYLEGKSRYFLYKNFKPLKIILIPNRMVVNSKTSQFPHIWIIWNMKEESLKTEFIWSLL